MLSRIIPLQLRSVKDWSRQISELSSDDFALLHSATLSPSGLDVTIATSKPVSEQLCSLLEKLRLTQEVETSDSGAVSDFSEMTEYRSQSCTSLTAMELEEGEEGGHKQRDFCEMASSESSSNDKARVKSDIRVWIEEVCNEACRRLKEDKEHDKETSPQMEESVKETPQRVLALKREMPPDLEAVMDAGREKEEGQRLADGESKGVAKAVAERKGDSFVRVQEEPVKIRRKSKRHYGWNWGRSCGYRSRTQRTMSSNSKGQSTSSFNHAEVAAFLWESKCNVHSI